MQDLAFARQHVALGVFDRYTIFIFQYTGGHRHASRQQVVIQCCQCLINDIQRAAFHKAERKVRGRRTEVRDPTTGILVICCS